jgi:hypothetical protein
MKTLRPMKEGRGTLRERIDPQGKGGIAAAPSGWKSVDPKSVLLKGFESGRSIFWKRWDKGVDNFQNTYRYLINNIPGFNNLLNPVAQTFQKKGEIGRGGGVDELIATTSQLRR